METKHGDLLENPRNSPQINGMYNGVDNRLKEINMDEGRKEDRKGE